MNYSQEQIDKMRAVRIHQLLNLPDDGRRKMISCPLHFDKTPSFVIYPDNSFHCYSCKAHGYNAIDFLTLLDGVGFKEALQELSKYI